MILLILLVGSPLFAHPCVGIVRDSRGNLYYTDLKQVWKISPDGKKSIVVKNVHSHELAIDADDKLYGEHLWYEGEATDRWGHRVWRLSPDGKLTDIIPSREGFLKDYGFVRDRAGNVYWKTDRAILERNPEGKIRSRARGDFRDARQMTSTADGVLYLVDGADVKRIDRDGRTTLLARNLRERRLLDPFTWFFDNHNLMGIWVDARENVYVAVSGGKIVKRIAPDGTVSVAARSKGRWSPTGGLVTPEGDLWVLEWGQPSKARVRRVGRIADP
ncbi:MAG TPA: hypothetical protein VM534_09910 [Thermoanaerobaculia bacterium]|nr:hypothetical protein [Thermoanaerobaculia bacterium]